jgi:hypothetical protein
MKRNVKKGSQNSPGRHCSGIVGVDFVSFR